MKRSIIATTVALGLACAVGVSVAQDQAQSANMQRVTVTATPGQYETYVIALDTGFSLEARVGNTHTQYMQAQRATGQSETLRRQGMASAPVVAVALDNSSGLGLVRQIQLQDGERNMLAMVNVYCSHGAELSRDRCRFVPQRVSGKAPNEALASRPMGGQALAQIKVSQSSR